MMKTLTLFRAAGPTDAKNILRDPLLLWLPLIPLLLALAMRLALPQLATVFAARYGFDVAPYYPLLMSGYMLLTLTFAGLVTGLLLLDERDEHVLTALLATPMPLVSYVLYRISMPMLLGWLMALIGIPLAGLVPIPLADLLIVAGLGALSSPLVALFLASFAANKVVGLALLKLASAVMLLPAAAFFLPERWQFLAGVVPAFWPMKAFWLAAAGRSYWLYVVIGMLVHAVALVLLMRRFNIVVHR